MRIAVITTSYGDDRWIEERFAVRQLVGALTCVAEVDVLLVGDAAPGNRYDSRARLVGFQAAATAPLRRRVLFEETVGAENLHWPSFCACIGHLARDIASRLPAVVERRLAETNCGDCQPLYAHLRDDNYEIIVIAGYQAGTIITNRSDVLRGRRVVLVPLAREEPSIYLRPYDEIFNNAERILVMTQTEVDLVKRRLSKCARARVYNVGFAVQVNQLAAATVPNGFDDKQYIVVARNWAEPFALAWLYSIAGMLNRQFDGIELCLIGPGAERLPSGPGLLRRPANSRLDVWRWMSRAFAVLDPEAHRLLGRDVMEAMLHGTPVLVPAHGGATHEYAESGNGGLYYRNDLELRACVRELCSPELRAHLARQGREYGEAKWCDSDGFVRRVVEAVL